MVMNKNEAKKVLYREKPVAKMLPLPNGAIARKGIIQYRAETSAGEILFDVDVADMGDADLFPEMPAQLMIRYLVSEDASLV